MRISTQQAFLNSVSNMQNSQSKLADLQNQISTGKKLSKPSDDPVAAAQIVKLNRELAQTEKFQDNIEVTQRRLELEETVLDSINTATVRMRELTIQAGNSTLNDADRKAIAAELRGLADYAAGLMNTRDSQGEYLFSGSKGFTQPYVKDAEGQYSYTGDDGQRMIQVAPELLVPSNDSGLYLFEAASESILVTPTPESSANVTAIEVVDQDVFADFAKGKGDLSLQVQLKADDSARTYQYQILDSDGQPLALDEQGALTLDLPEIGDGERVSVHGLEFTVNVPDEELLTVEFEQSGLRGLSVAAPIAANQFFQQYGEVELTFDGAGAFTLTNSEGKTITVEDQTYVEGEDLILGGFRLEVDSPEAGDSVTLAMPLPAFSPITNVDVSNLDLMYDTSVSGGTVRIVGDQPPAGYDFAANGAETFSLTVDGVTHMLTIDDAVTDLESAKAELEDALSDAGVTGVVVGDDGSAITLASATAAPGSDIEVFGFDTNIGAAFGLTDGQRDRYYTSSAIQITAAAAPNAHDFSGTNAETFDLTVDGETYTLTIDAPITDLESAQDELANALSEAGVTGVVVGESGGALTLASATAQAGSEIGVSNLGDNIATAFSFSEGQNDQFHNAITDVITNGGELKVTYDQLAGAYYVDAPGLRVDGTPVSEIGVNLSWDAANPPSDGESLYLKLPPYSESNLKVETNKQNVLDVALELAAVLEVPADSPEQREILTDQIASTLNKLEAVASRNIEARTTIGARLNSLENTLSTNADFKLFTQSALSSLEDVDFAEAVSELQLEEAILQAAQASFVRVSELSLFNFIR